MPPLPGFKVDAVARLARELRFVPRERLLDDIRRAEDLALEIDPDTLYPHDWLVFRVTGYRPTLDNPPLIVGKALRRDLVALVEHLCHAARLHEGDHAPDELITPDDLAARMGIGRKTLDRRRREGLPSRRVIGADSRPRVAFRAALIEPLLRDAPPVPARSPRFRAAERQRMLRRADRYARLGLSLNAAALRIARRYDRSHEGVRQLLRREDARRLRAGQLPRFQQPAPLTPRRRAAILRAERMGCAPPALADAAGITRPALRRALIAARAELLLTLHDQGHLRTAHPSHADDDQALLDTDAARTGLAFAGPTRLVVFLDEAARPSVSPPRIEAARMRALHTLRHRADGAIAALDRHHPSAAAVDRIETDLRWISRLKASLLAPELRVILGAIESRLARPLTTIPPDRVAALVLRCVRNAADALDSMDPARAGRVAAAVSLSVDRAVAQWARAHPLEAPRKATYLISPDAPVADWTRRVAPWRGILELDPRLISALPALDETPRHYLTRRYALDGLSPATRASLARTMGLNTIRVALFEQEALAAAWRLVRNTAAGRS
ncbi:MAG: hypothetical protein IPM33_05980 [Phycisphaerales bacterium]|nr:hypothetical protein [Phycisphaerales bacterium]